MTPAQEVAPSNWNVANVLTVLRIVLVPVMLVVLFLHPHDQTWRLAATLVFILAMLTDLADGQIARRRNLVTDFGKLWDPVADKLLTGAAFVSLGILGELWWSLIAIILVREWGITWLRASIAKYGIMAANRGGKAKTVTQTIALILFLLWLEPLPSWIGITAWTVMWIAVALTVVTGLDYIRGAMRIRREALEAEGRDTP